MRYLIVALLVLGIAGSATARPIQGSAGWNVFGSIIGTYPNFTMPQPGVFSGLMVNPGNGDFAAIPNWMGPPMDISKITWLTSSTLNCTNPAGWTCGSAAFGTWVTTGGTYTYSRGSAASANLTGTFTPGTMFPGLTQSTGTMSIGFILNSDDTTSNASGSFSMDLADTTPPTGTTIAASPATWTKNSPAALTFSATDTGSGMDHYELSLNGGTFFTATSPYNWDVSGLATGTYAATVKAFDKAGNSATASTSVYIDKTAPTGTVIAANPATWTKNSPVALTFSASDANSGIDHYELSLNGGAFFTATSPYSWDVSGLATGTYAASVKAVDKAGNSATASTSVYIDKTAPTGTTIAANPSTWTKNSLVALTFSASDANSGVDHYELSLNGGAFLTATSPYNWDVSGLATGTYTASVKAVDKVGNYTTTSTSVYIDRTPPTISIVAYPSPGPVLQGTYSIVVTAADPISGLAGAPTLVVSGTTVSAPVESPAGTFTYTTAIDSSTSNGAHSVNASVSDIAGNLGSAVGRTFTVNKNQITGSVELEGFIGGTRTVTFVVDGGLQTWTVPVSCAGAIGSFTLTNVPDGITVLSAKANWNLRKKLACSLDGDGQAVVSFTGSSKLLGGDLDGTNSINLMDYTVLKLNWLRTGNSSNPADVTGDGTVNTADYNYVLANWFKVGDSK